MDMTIVMKFMSLIVFDLLSHLRSEVRTGLLDSRSVIISLMTKEVRQIGWTFLFQSGLLFSKGLERKVAKEMAGLKAFMHSSLFSCAQILHKSVGERGEEL
jgi:hypothetical protein